MKRFFMSMFAALAVMLALTGCGREFVINTAQVSAGVALLDVQFDAVTHTLSKLEFSPSERAQLEVSHQRLDELRSAAHDLVINSGGLSQAIVKLDQVRRLADTGRAAYVTARSVICPDAPDEMLTVQNCSRLLQLPPADQDSVIAFDLHARHTNDVLQQLLNSPSGTDITQAVSDVLTVGAAAARIAQIGGALL